ncbi:MAG: AMP-binding protein [Pseudomonadota bacterium]
MDKHLLDALTLWQLVLLRAAATPDALMLIDADGARWSFAQFAAGAARVAATLQAHGVRDGSVVTWQMPTSVGALLVSTALARLGAVQNPVIHLYGKKELAAILGQNRSALMIVPARAERDFETLARAVIAELAQPPALLVFDLARPTQEATALPAAPLHDDVRWVYYTSGTSAEPKGVRHTDASLIAGGRALASALGVTAADIGSLSFPVAHVGGSMYLVMLLSVGMAALVLPSFDPDKSSALFTKYGVSVTGGSTAHYQGLLNAQRRQPGTPLAPTLRLLSGGGAAKPPALYYQLRDEMGLKVAHSYGMTEAPMISGGSPLHSDEQLAHSDGKPVAGMSIRIVRADGGLAANGEAGEIRIKGPTLCRGYTDPELSAAAFDADGYFHTGDIGLLRPDGHLALTGRLKDVIIRKGENVSAQELEQVLGLHPKVGAVAVIGLPDSERGERVCAVVELRDPAVPFTFEEMVACFEAAGAMRQKIPEQLEVIDRLPRNETFNKVLKFKLRERFTGEPHGR